MNDREQMRGHVRETKPRVVQWEVHVRTENATQRIMPGTIVRAAPGSERELGGPGNLRTTEHYDRGGVTN